MSREHANHSAGPDPLARATSEHSGPYPSPLESILRTNAMTTSAWKAGPSPASFSRNLFSAVRESQTLSEGQWEH